MPLAGRAHARLPPGLLTGLRRPGCLGLAEPPAPWKMRGTAEGPYVQAAGSPRQPSSSSVHSLGSESSKSSKSCAGPEPPSLGQHPDGSVAWEAQSAPH